MCLQSHLSHEKEKGHHIGRHCSVFSRHKQTITIISRVQTTKSEIRQIKCRRYAPNGGVPAEVSYVAGSFASISSKSSNTLI